MQENFNLSDLFNIKLSTFFAGLFGATITLMKKGEGSILARLGGYISAIFAIIYVVPFAIDIVRYMFNYNMSLMAEQILAFTFGLLANNAVEKFLDDPAGAVKKWFNSFIVIKQAVLTNAPIEKVEKEKNDLSKETVTEISEDKA